MSLHYDFRKGTSVFVILKDGTKYVDKFVESKGSRVKLRDTGFIPYAKIRSIGINRLRQP